MRDRQHTAAGRSRRRADTANGCPFRLVRSTRTPRAEYSLHSLAARGTRITGRSVLGFRTGAYDGGGQIMVATTPCAQVYAELGMPNGALIVDARLPSEAAAQPLVIP